MQALTLDRALHATLLSCFFKAIATMHKMAGASFASCQDACRIGTAVAYNSARRGSVRKNRPT
jgi:hypothetical protein